MLMLLLADNTGTKFSHGIVLELQCCLFSRNRAICLEQNRTRVSVLVSLTFIQFSQLPVRTCAPFFINAAQPCISQQRREINSEVSGRRQLRSSTTSAAIVVNTRTQLQSTTSLYSAIHGSNVFFYLKKTLLERKSFFTRSQII